MLLTRQFGREVRAFRLCVPQWMAVEKACDSGLGEIMARLAPLVSLLETGLEGFPGGLMQAVAVGALGRARLVDVREPLIQGLIGEGMTSTMAGALVALVFDEAVKAGQAPMLEFAPLAYDILARAVIGLPDETIAPGEATATGPAKARRRSRTAKPASSRSTPPPP